MADRQIDPKAAFETRTEVVAVDEATPLFPETVATYKVRQ